VKVRLQTGRSHQIRVHFSHAGHALLGDKKYAKKPWSEIFHRPALHAWEIVMPSGQKFQAPLPDDFKALLKQLGG
jgi:23S rRNA pseudouridine1911/1915/1917 synthase